MDGNTELGADGLTYWVSYEYVSASNATEASYASFDGGASWELYAHPVSGDMYDGIFTLTGTCESLGLEDTFSPDFGYFPNPVSDV